MQKTEPEQIDANYGTMTEIAGKFKFEHLENEIIFNTVFQHKKTMKKFQIHLLKPSAQTRPPNVEKFQMRFKEPVRHREQDEQLYKRSKILV